MDERASIRIAKASFDRCNGSPDFLTGFYEHFFEACPDAKPLFARTDIEKQARALRDAIGLLLIAPFLSGDQGGEGNMLSRIAERHSRRQLNVEPRFYAPFIESLLATVEKFDPEYSPDVDVAWRSAIAKGVAYMRARY